MKNKISIIIPTYKEEKNIVSTLKDLEKKGFGNSEIIVVDGSPDELTKKQVEKFSQVIYCKLLNSFRSGSMNRGAEIATGDILFFLHADSILPSIGFKELENVNLTEYNYGCFYKEFVPNSIILKLIAGVNNMQTHLFGTMLGDNGIFVSRKLFDDIGCYREIKLMEDIEISKTLKNAGKIKIIKNKIQTSSRKFQKNGVLRTLLFMQYIRFLYLIGTDAKVLEEKYRKF